MVRERRRAPPTCRCRPAPSALVNDRPVYWVQRDAFDTFWAVYDIANRRPDYVLRWPRELFVLAAKAILAAAAARLGGCDRPARPGEGE